MKEIDLRDVLIDCQESAKTGYKIATTQEKKLKKALGSAKETIQDAILDFNSSSCYAREPAELLTAQLSEINKSFDRLSFAFQEDLNNLSDNLSEFSITLFGRTMAGKSTLREILTEGDGSSIGKGAQRTTLDVTTYHWNSLRITDVPGIGAFEGEEDEQLAFEAAKQADMVLFLITDDAPQAVEANFFNKIVKLGKPILGIINVKQAINEQKSLKYNLRKIKEQFDYDRLNKIKEQFYQFAQLYGQSWTHIPFVFVHLQAAFMSQVSSDKNIQKCFCDVSRIEVLKKRIIEQVQEKGQFYRIKTFIDIISNPLLESMENLLEQSELNSVQGRTLLSKKRQFKDWKDRFYRDGKAQIQSLVVRIQSELKGEIASFAEDHFDDKNADKAWYQLLKTRGIEKRCQELLNCMESRCYDHLREISREIRKELSFSISFSQNKSLRMREIDNGKKVWEWASVIVGGGLSIASGITALIGAAVAGPLGLAALAVSVIGVLGSFLFKSRDQEVHEARFRLENNLRKEVSRICNNLYKQIEESLDFLVSEKIDKLLSEIEKLTSVVFSLSDTQRKLAWDLNTHLLGLNKQLMTEAIRLIGAEGLQYHVLSVARTPGNTSLLLLNDGTIFPQQQKIDLEKMMSERIRFVFDSDDKQILISRIIGQSINRSQIRIEKKIGVAHVPLQNATPDMKNRVRLAQQFSRILIMNQ